MPVMTDGPIINRHLLWNTMSLANIFADVSVTHMILQAMQMHPRVPGHSHAHYM